MAERVFCIDFGSSYTKVALRRNPGTDAEVLRPDLRIVGVPDFCVPSTVGVERQGPRNVPICGVRAISGAAPSGGRYTNWKRSVFSSGQAGQVSQKAPLDAFLDSSELLDLATKYGVSSSQLVHLRNLVANARALAGGSATMSTPEAHHRAAASAVAYHFFSWLRGEVVQACERLKLDGLNPETIPVRITAPAFGHGKDLEQHPGCQLLMTALTRAGWRLHTDRPIVSEPYSNAIGVLTNGSNVAHNSRLQLRRMFRNGPVMRALTDPVHYSAYRALVVDVGAYTTDFAAVTLKPEGKTVDDPDLAFTVEQHSVPIGISNLDAKVFEALPNDKGGWLTAAEPVQLEAFRQRVYTDGKPYRTVEVGVIGGTTDTDALRAAVDAFLTPLIAETVTFCDTLETIALQELILTGGGVSIPSVRDAIINSATQGGREFVKTHAPGLKKGAVTSLVNSLKEEMTRGGSALGGASIYFEKEYY